MSERAKKFDRLKNISDGLDFGLASRLKLFSGSYLPRLKNRLAFIPCPVWTLRFQFEGRLVRYNIRSNDLDFAFLEAIFLRGEYDCPTHPCRILDLGGNIGSADIYFHYKFPGAKFVTVEPLPENLTILRKNWADNGIEGSIIPGAVSNRSGKATFYLSDPDCSSLIQRAGLGAKTLTVDCITIPQILDQAGWDEIDLLKIDIEGGEVSVFQDSAGWASKVKVIVGELHNGYSIADADRDLGNRFECTEVFDYALYGMKGLLAIRKSSS